MYPGFKAPNLCSRLFQTKNYIALFLCFVNYVSLTLLSVSCCWAGNRMLATDWLTLYVALEQPLKFLSF